MLVKYHGYKEIDLSPGDIIEFRNVFGSCQRGLFIDASKNKRNDAQGWGGFTWVRVLLDDNVFSMNSNLLFSIEKL